MKNPLVSIIFVNWNGMRFVESCFKSLSKISYKPVEVIFVDNASTDGSPDWVAKHYPKFRVIRNKKNVGFALGHESALRFVHGKYVLLLNVDTEVEINFLTGLVKRLSSDSTIGVVQPKVLLHAEPHRIDSIGSFFLPNGFLYHYGREKDETLSEYNRPMEIYSAKGVCMLIRREVLAKVGLFDEDYFAYFEETDFCMRVWLAGWKIYYEPNSRIYHKGGGSAKQQPPFFILFHATKNVFITYVKNMSIGTLIYVLPLYLVCYFGGMLISLLTGKFETVRAMALGLSWNISHMSSTLSKRKKVQKLRSVSDKEYLPGLMHPVHLSYYYHQFFGNLRYYKDIPILSHIT